MRCWLWDNGLATVDDNGTLAGYMDDGMEQAYECREGRREYGGECPVHGWLDEVDDDPDSEISREGRALALGGLV